jgi:hypothetical protein
MDDATNEYQLKINLINSYYESIVLNIQKEYEFPFDDRYIKLLDENLSNENLESILSTYSDEEIDLFIDKLEDNIYNTSFDSVLRKENVIFNTENDKIVLKKVLTEYDKRF